jgi:hypothetical protein
VQHNKNMTYFHVSWHSVLMCSFSLSQFSVKKIMRMQN